MGFFTKLFGFDQSEKSAETEAIEYSGFEIYPEPVSRGGQFQINGRICKTADGEIKTHEFIRSDILSSREDAVEIMVKKSKMFIDQMGDDMYS